MWDRKLKKQLRGKVLEACVVPTCIYGLGTLPLIERHKEKMQIAEKQMVPKNMQRMGEDRLSKRARKADEVGRRRKEKEDKSCDGKTVSNEILKRQVRTAKSGKSPLKTEGNGEH